MDQELVSYLVAVAAAPYDIYREDWNDKKLEYWVPPGTPKSELTNTVEQTAKILQWFSERTGVVYPYDVYRQVFVQRFLFTGMENTTTTIQERRILHPDNVHATRAWPQEVVAHEIAHQWYGDLLTCRAWRELWLNEGFATFMASDWGEYRFGKPHLARAVLNRIDRLEQGSRHPMVRRHWLPGDHGVNHNVYSKGALTLQSLRVLVGDEVFWAGIRRYTKEHSNRLVETDDLRRAFEEETGLHLSWFFEQWAYHLHVPEVSVSQRFSEGQLQVTLKQKVSETEPAFSLPVDVRIPVEGDDIYRRIWLTDGDPEVLSLALAEAPPYVVIDGQGGLLAKLEQEQDAAAWIAQLADDSAFARIRAMRALAKGERTDEAVTALTHRLQDRERHWVERQEAAGALAKLRTGEDALIQTLSDPDDRLRESGAIALGQMVRSEAISDALAERIQKDPNDDVRATAIGSLGPIDPVRALKIARKELKRASTPNEVVEQAAVRLLGARGEDRDFSTVAAVVGDDGNSYRLRTTAAWAAARQIARADSGEARRTMRVTLSRALEPWLTDLHQRARETAVHLLAEVGDRDAIPALDTLAHTTTLENLRESAINAQKQIRSRSDEIDEPNEAELIARIEALEKRADAIDKKLESTREWH
jgi:aminopeptidase N